MDDKPYTIHSPTKITLSADARWWAKQHGMTDQQMAKYLLDRERLGENYETTGEVGPVE